MRARRDRARPRPTSRSSASTGSGASTRPRSSTRCGPTPTLVSVQLANHEVGTVQPVAEVCAALRDRDVLVHVDACAAAGHVAGRLRALGADLCSVTAHKFGGPLGAGALLVRRGLRVPPLLVGGAQERARRGGIENVPAWVGFGAACAAVDLDARGAGAARARSTGGAPSSSSSPGVERFGDGSLPNVLCLGVDGVEAEPILLALDQHGVAVHSGSSCSSETLEPSPVLEAMGVDADRSLRISVGWSSTTGRRRPVRGSVPGNRRTPPRVANRMTATVRRLNHAVLYVRDARRAAALLRARRSGSRCSPSTATAPRSSCARPRPRTTTTSACSRSGAQAPPPAAGPRRPVPPRLAGRHDPRSRRDARASAAHGRARRRERPRRDEVALRARTSTATSSRSCGWCPASSGAPWSTRPSTKRLDLAAELAQHS